MTLDVGFFAQVARSNVKCHGVTPFLFSGVTPFLFSIPPVEIRAGNAPYWLWIIREYASDGSDWVRASIKPIAASQTNLFLDVHIRRQGFRTPLNRSWRGKADARITGFCDSLETAFRIRQINLSVV